jgi:murein DD-endopeptidase MepM/ murein hydrolase activator NlpD
MRKFSTRTLLVLATVFVFSIVGAAFGAETEVQKLQNQIRALQDEVKNAGDAYSAAYWALDATRVQIAEVDRQIAAEESELASASALLGERVAEMYRSGSAEYLRILLSSDDLNDVFMRLEFMERVSSQDAQVIEDIKRIRADLTAKRAGLEELRLKQNEEAERLKADAARIEAELKAQQTEYDRLQRQLAAAIAAEKARTGSTSARVGPNGMVFPVNGPHYYQDTWGAARSGGRTHKGTDIMAKEGVPCVAVLSGTVRAKSNSLGGLTIWLTADNGWAFYYAHLSRYQVTSGRVQAGQVIGYVGSTGNASASAPHLHFEIHPNGGAAVNPYPYLRQMQ